MKSVCLITLLIVLSGCGPRIRTFDPLELEMAARMGLLPENHSQNTRKLSQTVGAIQDDGVPASGPEYLHQADDNAITDSVSLDDDEITADSDSSREPAFVSGFDPLQDSESEMSSSDGNENPVTDRVQSLGLKWLTSPGDHQSGPAHFALEAPRYLEFSYSLDRDDFRVARASFTLTDLRPGRHVLELEARDPETGRRESITHTWIQGPEQPHGK